MCPSAYVSCRRCTAASRSSALLSDGRSSGREVTVSRAASGHAPRRPQVCLRNGHFVRGLVAGKRESRPWSVSDELWSLIEPLLPEPGPKLVEGRPRIPDRQALCGILSVPHIGIEWEYRRRSWASGRR
ncbi:transposase [Streptomyces rishiriensis]|uniref:transposase n=1 Tax=Streptomyces rishiriensis TaxID=68264 RepID=UPI0037D1344D